MEKWSFSRKEPWGICSGVGNDNPFLFLQLWNLRLDFRILQPCDDWVLFWAWHFPASKIATNSSQISNSSRLDASVIGVIALEIWWSWSISVIPLPFVSSVFFAKELGWESSRVTLENDTNAALLAEVWKAIVNWLSDGKLDAIDWILAYCCCIVSSLQTFWCQQMPWGVWRGFKF